MAEIVVNHIEKRRRILACISNFPGSMELIRQAAGLAHALQAEWTVLYVETNKPWTFSSDWHERLREHMQFAESLGAKTITLYGTNIVAQIADYVRISDADYIVVGRTSTRSFFQANIADKLIWRLSHKNIYVITHADAASRKKLFKEKRENSKRPKTELHENIKDIIFLLLLLLLATFIGGLCYWMGLQEAVIVTIYLLGVLLVSIITSGMIYGGISSFISVVIFNFFFTEPLFDFHYNDPSYAVTFLVMLATSLLVNMLTTRIKRQTQQSSQKAWRTEILLDTSQRLQESKGHQETLAVIASQIVRLLRCGVVIYPVLYEENVRKLEQGQYFDADGVHTDNLPAEFLNAYEKEAATRAYETNSSTGASTNVFSDAKCLYLTVGNHSSVFAVAGIVMQDIKTLDPFDSSLLLAILAESGLALEKESIQQTKNKIAIQAEQERLRANLLRSISHDLRTPLTSISGNAAILLEDTLVTDPQKRHMLCQNIYDDSMWLITLVENLLTVTRIENGTIGIKMAPELLDEVIQEAILHVNKKISEHVLTISIQEEFLLAQMDVRLIMQVIINLIDNAIQYTPPGSHIDISARWEGEKILVRIADDGPGIAPHQKEGLFNMFVTDGKRRGDGRRGLGLGLFLCRSIVLAHHGEIWVEDNDPHGSVFHFTLLGVNVEKETQE